MGSRAAQPRLPWWRRVPDLQQLVLVTTLSLYLAALGLMWAFTWMSTWSWEREPEFVSPHPPKPERGCLAFPSGAARLNILLAGVDNNYDSRGMPYTRGARADALMVVSLSSTAQFCNVVSIPRDTLTSAGKINELYSRGGLRATLPAVEELLGVPIDRYVVVKLSGAKRFMDALGGLELEVPRRLRYTDQWARLEIDLKPGRQALTGQEALGYARYLDPRDGDHARLHRHRQLVKAGLRKLKDPAVVMKAPELAKAFKECCETDLKVMEMMDLAMLYRDFDPRKLHGAQLVGDDCVVNGQSVVVPYAPANRVTVRALLQGRAGRSFPIRR